MSERKKLRTSTKIIFIVVAVIVAITLILGNTLLTWWVYPYIWYKRVAFAFDNNKCESGRVVFVGDSITDGCDLDKYYEGLGAINRGISGDTTGGVLNRMKISAYDLKPSLIVLLIGTNDYQRIPPHKNENILKNYRKILTGFKEKLPDTPVIVQSVYPIADVSFHNHYRYGHGNIEDLNEGIKSLAEEYGYYYADVYSLLVEGEEEMNMEYSEDGLHPNEKGYEVISAYLRPIINGIINS